MAASSIDTAIERGDVFNVLNKLVQKPERKLRYSAIITSPPYYRQRHYGDDPNEIGRENTVQEYLNRLTNVFEMCRQLLKSDGTLWIVIGDARQNGSKSNIPHKLAEQLEDVGYKLRDDIIWYKKNHVSSSSKNSFTSAYEYILYFAKGEEARVDRIDMSKKYSNVWDIPTLSHKGQGHYAMYPETLVARILEVATEPNDYVLDPFAGRGTTGMVCMQMGRNFTGIELYENFHITAQNNIRNSSFKQKTSR